MGELLLRNYSPTEQFGHYFGWHTHIYYFKMIIVVFSYNL